jgi:Protein of unknown function (DUF3363)
MLNALGTRRDTVDTIHRALADHGLADERGIDQYVLHGSGTSERVVGQVIGKRLAGDEMGERAYLVSRLAATGRPGSTESWSPMAAFLLMRPVSAGRWRRPSNGAPSGSRRGHSLTL